MNTKINLTYAETKRKEIKETKKVTSELCNLINIYSNIVTGKAKKFVSINDVNKMFSNIEIIDFTIEYANSCLKDIKEIERYYLVLIISKLKKLKKIKEEEIPF